MAGRNSNKLQEHGRTGWRSRSSNRHLIVSPMPRCVRGLLEILDFPARFRVSETMVERSLFRLIVPVVPTTSMVAVGLPNTGKYDKNKGIVGDRRG
jgi:hypothetical protein